MTVRSRRPRGPAVRLPVLAGYLGAGFAFHPPQFPSLLADPTPFGHRLPSQVLGTRNSSTARLLTPRMFVHPRVSALCACPKCL